MRDEILDLLQKEFLAKQFYGEKIEVKIDLKDMVEKRITESNIQEPDIYITVNAYQKILTLTKEYSTEVAWHCLVEHPQGTNAYLIYDVLVFPQEVTGGTANGIDGEYEMWLATLPDEQFERVRCHMHSHVNMGVTPSGVDEGYYSNLMTQVTDYYITMIINKKSEYHLRFYDKANNILYTDKELIICFEDGTPLSTWYDSVKGMVKEKVYTPTATTPSPYRDYDYDSENYWKKKETTTTLDTGARGRGRPKKNEGKKADDYTRITGPDNVQHTFINIDSAVNYIYNNYPKDNHTFSKNMMRHNLAKYKALAYNPHTHNFDYEFMDKKGGLEYAILRCDLWEVIKNESE